MRNLDFILPVLIHAIYPVKCTARPRLTRMTGPEINRTNRKPCYFLLISQKIKTALLRKLYSKIVLN